MKKKYFEPEIDITKLNFMDNLLAHLTPSQDAESDLNEDIDIDD